MAAGIGDGLSPLLPSFPPAVLALADGTLFSGSSIGAPGETAGEVVFNTALTGYQEIITDPSYCRQIVTLTYPHIGNVGARITVRSSNKLFIIYIFINLYIFEVNLKKLFSSFAIRQRNVNSFFKSSSSSKL